MRFRPTATVQTLLKVCRPNVFRPTVFRSSVFRPIVFRPSVHSIFVLPSFVVASLVLPSYNRSDSRWNRKVKKVRELLKVPVLLLITGKVKPANLARDISGMQGRILIRFFLLVCLQQLYHICENCKNYMFTPSPLWRSVTK